MKKRYKVYGFKPYRWFKGSTLVLLGLLLSRWEVGIGRLDINIYFGLPIFFLIACSTILVSIILKMEDMAKFKMNSKKLTIISAVLFGAGFVTSLVHTIYYNLDSLNIYLLAIVGVILVLSVLYGKNWEKKHWLTNILISVCSSFGLIYGASLNGILIPFSIYVFFGATFSLQFSKDLISESKNKERYREVGVSSLSVTIGEKRTKSISILLDIIVIILLLLPVLFDIFYIPFLLYLIPMSITVIIIGIATVFTFSMKTEKTYYRLINILLRIGMFFLFVVIFCASF